MSRMLFFTFLIISAITLLASCDRVPPTQITDAEKEFKVPQYSTSELFFSYSDSSNKILRVAVDTLKQRNKEKDFIDEFISERGYPEWDAASAFYSGKIPILLVPVTNLLERKVTGVVFVTMIGKQPIYWWISRGADLQIAGFPNKESLETLMLGYEKRVFGKTQKTGISVRVKTEEVIPTGRKYKYVWVQVAHTSCWSTCAGDNCGEWTCETTYTWETVIVDGSGDDGISNDGFGGGKGDLGGDDTDFTNHDPKEDLPTTDAFLGEIDYSDLANHPRIQCIYSNLSQTNTMENVVSKFAGDITNFDLVIEVVNMDEGTLGSLNSSLGSNIFTMQINGLELDRTPIEIAGTFLHEAIHAEMRRYLYGAMDTSTLPGFPGNFADDWDNYILEKYEHLQEPVTAAEHQAMANKYVEIIADGLAEYDSNRLNHFYYEALAWVGLIDTETWNKLSQTKKNEIGENYQNLEAILSERSMQCQ